MTCTRRRFLTRAAAATACGARLFWRPRAARAAGKGGEAFKVDLDDAPGFAGVKKRLENDYPGIRLSRVAVDGEALLRAERGGMRVFWIYQGQGEVLLPAGYRTQEGGPGLLPAGYTPDPVDPAFAAMLRGLEEGLPAMALPVTAQVQAVLDRRRGNTFVGDFAVVPWNLEHVPRPWSTDEGVEALLVALFGAYRKAGWSTKQAGAYEPVTAGDQIVACGAQAVPVRGRFRCLAMERVDRTVSHISTVRRLRYLVDTAGGCSFDFDPYRRLPLTWYMDAPGMQGDGLNFVNSHVVNIPRELSSTHFHPRRPLRGGLPQTEMYLVLDPRAAGLDARGREASILLFPDLRDLKDYKEFPLRPGDFVVIPPGVAHRGLDVFVNVLTIPGFKPHNEIYIDRDILDRTGGKAPYNENGLGRKNYDRLEDFL